MQEKASKQTKMNRRLILLLLIAFILTINKCNADSKPQDHEGSFRNGKTSNLERSPEDTDYDYYVGGKKPSHRYESPIRLWSWRWHEVRKYFVAVSFLLVAALIKITYHHLHVLHAYVPESW